MKKILLVLIFIIASIGVSFAQEGIYIGARLSPHISIFSSSVHLGTAFGGAVGYQKNEKLGIEANLLYSNDGWSNSYHYIKIPVFVKLNPFKKMDKLRPYIAVGPQLYFLTNKNVKYNFFNYGIIVGVGGDYKLTEQLFLTGLLRNEYGFTGYNPFNLGVTLGISFYLN